MALMDPLGWCTSTGRIPSVITGQGVDPRVSELRQVNGR